MRNRQEEQHRSHFVNYINNEVIPNNLVLIGRVVFIERDLVTIHINYNGSIYSAYIRKEELAWEKIQNAADVVFLGEELQVKFSHFERKKPYFNFKWQQIDLYPSDLFYMNTDELLSTAGVSENLFVAKATITRQFDDEEKETISAYASNFITLGEGDNNTLFIDKYTGVNISAKISSALFTAS